jgi:ribose 5-phosphate isomerase B
MKEPKKGIVMNYKIALGADHRGFALKEKLRVKRSFGTYALTWQDVGTHSSERTDYPLFVHRVADLLLSNQVDYGVIICGSGIGVSIASNRFPQIYAGLVWGKDVAKIAKEHNNVNILILPADYITVETAYECIEAWLSGEFKEGRYQERLRMIETVNKKEEL